MTPTSPLLCGPKVSLEAYERSQRSGRKAKSLSESAKATRREIRALREARRERKGGGDPLVSARIMRPFRLAARREARAEQERLDALRSSATYPAWNTTFRERVETATRRQDGVEREARAATLEAICREARKRGWTIRHTSSSRDGRVSSRYIEVPDVGECRVSDHELPETEQRFHNRLTYGAPRWNGEVVIESDWRDTSLEAWMRRILLAAAGRY